MALSQATLSGLLKDNIKAIAGISVTNEAELIKFTDAVAKAVVDHIKAAATITGTGSVTSGVGSGGTVAVTTGAVL